MTSIFPLEMSDVGVRRKGKTILGPITLSLHAQGFTIIVGPNGSGKTTLLRVMHGVERISTGQVKWAVDDAIARRQHSYVFQTPILLRRTVWENIYYPLKLNGVSRADAAPQIADWAARIGLSDLVHNPATRLSGGERQKLALARALIAAPAVLFLDEPSSNLDGRATREIEAILREASAKGTRIVMTTHDLGQAKRLATDALFVLGGQIREAGLAPDIFARPQTPELAAFLRGEIVD